MLMTTEAAEPVLIKLDGLIARITLNRPEKRNALNDALIDGISNALVQADTNETVRAVVIRGAGTDFCSGADLSTLQKIAEGSVMENRTDAARLAELFLQIRGLSMPVIAAVHGRALAGGCGLATACDIVLASGSARFGYPEVKIGFVPAMVMAILRRNVSEKRAFELITRGAEIAAAEAERIGLVNQVFADDEFDQRVDEYLEGFSKVSRSAVALSKKLLYDMDGISFQAAIEAGIDTNVIARFTEDCKAGVARFLKK
jgi:methylglutaconyl-CoA hydratase